MNAAKAHERAQKNAVEKGDDAATHSSPFQHPVILMLYINSPCVVIGRNQNPWVELNIPRIMDSLKNHNRRFSKEEHEVGSTDPVWPLRRKSGGGTVFHDLGNVNFSAIVPAAEFTRDKHAEMVVEALKRGGAREKGVRVNERHDVVMSASGVSVGGEGGTVGEVKLSGSAYKLTRTTALHHGTMLVDTELGRVKKFIDSGARAWIKGRGVASVRSPISNIKVDGGVVGFAEEVGRAWGEMYDVQERAEVWSAGRSQGNGEVAVCFVSEEVASSIPEIEEGRNELQGLQWMFDQTPKFTFSIPVTPALLTYSSSSPPAELPPPPEDLEKPNTPVIQITCEKGLITDVELRVPEGAENVDLGIDIPLLKQRLTGAFRWFDGGNITDFLKNSKVHPEAFLLKWVEGILGRVRGRNFWDSTRPRV